MQVSTRSRVKRPFIRKLNSASLARSMVIIGFGLGMSVVARRTTLAIPVPVDVGSTGLVLGGRTVELAAPSLQFQGQNITIDCNFENDEFIRLFTATKFFQIDAFFRINNASLPPLNFTGSGFLEDSQGVAIGPTITLQAFPVTDLGHEIGVDLVLTALSTNVVPADVFGFHLDLALPDSPSFGFGHGPPGAVTFDGNIFGIGPGVPRDIVPDGGNTVLFLAGTLAALILIRSRLTSIS